MFKKIILSILFLGSPHLTWGWGLRGHDTICQAATFLVKNPDLQFFLKMRAPQMGHLCNVPDTHWKFLSSEIKDQGNPTHFINPEVVGLEAAKIPLDWTEIKKQFQGKPNRYDGRTNLDKLPRQLGSLWWRADQFVKLSIQQGKQGAIKQMLSHMGVLGHFVGDGSQPFHSTADYDGVKAGHPGIHGFYEHDLVALVDEKLLADIVDAGKKLTFKSDSSIVERMRELSTVSVKEAENLLKLDSKKVREKVSPAELQKFRALMTLQMARSAKLLAEFWDEIYLQSGKPDLKNFKDYSFIFQPDFVAPDYL